MEPRPQFGHFLRHPRFNAIVKSRLPISCITGAPFQFNVGMRTTPIQRNPEIPKMSKSREICAEKLPVLRFINIHNGTKQTYART